MTGDAAGEGDAANAAGPLSVPPTPPPALTPPLSVRLRERTAASHERIETALDLLNDRLTIGRYAALLERWYGFERTWERVAAQTFATTSTSPTPTPAGADPDPQGPAWTASEVRPASASIPTFDLPSYLRQRRKSALLERDLLALGRGPDRLDALPRVPDDALPWHAPSAALGVLYVVEGSTLGGRHVAKFVQNRLPLTAEHGVAYFNSYGDAVGVRWRETKAVLDAPPFAADEEQAIAGAIAAFDYLATWLTSTAPSA